MPTARSPSTSPPVSAGRGMRVVNEPSELPGLLAQAQAEAGAASLAALLRAETNLVAGVTWQPGWLERPADGAEMMAALWLNQPPEAVAALAARLAPARVILVAVYLVVSLGLVAALVG